MNKEELLNRLSKLREIALSEIDKEFNCLDKIFTEEVRFLIEYRNLETQKIERFGYLKFDQCFKQFETLNRQENILIYNIIVEFYVIIQEEIYYKRDGDCISEINEPQETYSASKILWSNTY